MTINKIKIGENARRIRVRLGISQSEIADKLGVKQETISQIELGKIAPSLEIINGYISNFSTNYNDFIHGNETINEIEVMPKPIESSIEVPEYNAEFMCGNKSGIDASQYILKIHLFPKGSGIISGDAIITASGDSMQPNIMSGDKIIHREISKEDIIYNHIYMFSTKDQLLIKQVKKSNDANTYLFTSINPAHEPFELPKKRILKAYKLIRIIRDL